MSDVSKKQHMSVLLGVASFAAVIIIIGIIGALTIGAEEDFIQGQVDASEYRVSSKLPGRILEIRVKEGDYVHAGDTLVILDAPEVEAKKMQAQSVESAAAAMSDMANAGARQEQIKGAYELWQQAKAGLEIYKKSYERVQRLFDEGVVSEQKRDEAFAQYKAYEAQEKAAQSQYEMAMNGARTQEKRAAAAKLGQAQGVVQEVNSYIHETVQVAQMDGQVESIYPKVGELVGQGSPIMTILLMNDIWGSFNVREDRLNGMKIGDTFTAFIPAFNKDIEMKVSDIKDQGVFATWKATKSNGQYDLKTFEVKARPVKTFDGLRPGMSLVIKE